LLEYQIAPDSPAWNYKSIAKGYTPPPAVPGKVNIPTWKSELYFEYHRGVMTTQANHKRNMREAEVEVLNAEKWASLAWVLAGRAYPSPELTEDWKKVLFNQFHDLAAGSGIGAIYKDAQKDYDVVRWSTNEISSGALESVIDQIDTRLKRLDNAQSVVVFNPLGWQRDGTVHLSIPVEGDQEGRTFLVIGNNELIDLDHINWNTTAHRADIDFSVHHLPAMGYATYHIGIAMQVAARQAVSPPMGQVGSSKSVLSLQHGSIKLDIDAVTGCITSLIESKSGTELLDHGKCGNQLQFFKDTPKDYDAWNVDPGTLDQPPATIAKAVSVEAAKANGSPAVRVSYTWQSSKFVQTISLKGDIVDVENDIDWHERHVLLKAAFPLAASSGFATYEIPYGSIERPTTRANSWEKAQFEVPAMRWADLGDGAHGLSVLNQTKYGYDAVGNMLRLTLLRSPTWPDPEADQGHHHFHYALYPHAGTWADALTVRHGWEYDYPLTAVVTTAHAGALPAEHSFASVEPDNVVLTAVKKAEDENGLIFRVYEWAGKSATVEFHVPAGATGATVTNLMETPEGSPLPVEGDQVKAPIHPYEILTIRVDYPKGGPKQ
jgi:alpha-mannosidase